MNAFFLYESRLNKKLQTTNQSQNQKNSTHNLHYFDLSYLLLLLQEKVSSLRMIQCNFSSFLQNLKNCVKRCVKQYESASVSICGLIPTLVSRWKNTLRSKGSKFCCSNADIFKISYNNKFNNSFSNFLGREKFRSRGLHLRRLRISFQILAFLC